MMKIFEGTPVNPSFSWVRYVITDTCQGRIVTAKSSGTRWHDLFDGKRWYTVPEEIFELWLQAYKLGKESSDKDRKDSQ